MSSPDDFKSTLSKVMLSDQHWLRQQSNKLKRSQRDGKPVEEIQERFQQRLQQSLDRCEQRNTKRPEVTFEQDLPINSHRDEIVAALCDNQVIVVAGETGSGKSTQLPKICLDAGYGVRGLIGHTQPRRIAARSVAQRIAHELKSPLGNAVGYKIRFDDKTNEQTYIKLMTDGILLAEAAGDRFLNQYEVLILDEAHERSLNVDFLLGMLYELLKKRPELKLIITSATIDAERFGEHFGTVEAPAPVIQVEGRTYPVEVRYRPLETEDGQTLTVYQGILNAVHELSSDGDMLIFLPTERDIREAAKRLKADKQMQLQQREILPLYARLSTAEQNKIFNPGNAQRIVLATNVAESSLTVPRIHCVIDTGTARISRFSSRLRMQRLPVEAVSRASADQRKGRCGRLGPGICIRLYDEADFLERAPFTTPEIKRTNLASVILQAKSLKMGEVDAIPLLDPPRPETIREGYKTLFEISAVDDHRRLTKTGHTLSRLPVDPRIARMVLAGDEENCLAQVLVICAALEIQDPRVRPIDRQQAADQAHQPFEDENSDFMSYLKLWEFVQTNRKELSRGKFQKLCVKTFLSPARLREWGEVHRQLRQLVQEQGYKLRCRSEDLVEKADEQAIHRALLRGLLSCVANKTDEREYTGAGGNKFFIWPGSGLIGVKPKWIVAAELVETTRRYGRTVARINPAWLESIGEHIIKKTYADPHWHEKSQSVMAFENVTLYGLPIVARRRVAYGHLDIEISRQIFIEEGLVSQKMEAGDGFFQNNAQVREEAEKLASKTRNRDMILDDYQIHAFYEQRIPDDVYDLASLRRAMKKDPTLKDRLSMSIEDLFESEAALDTNKFPPQLDVGSMQLPLSYHFEPGSDEDGVTVTVPASAASLLHSGHLEWLVPGLVEEKLIALIRSLPKAIRRGLVPAPDTAARVATELTFGDGDFLQQVAKRFSEIADERIQPSDFRLDKLAAHLRMRIVVIDDKGKEATTARSVNEVRAQIADSVELPDQTEALTDTGWHRDDVTTWDFGDLPPEVRVTRGGIEVAMYPAVVEFEDQTVGLRLEDSPGLARTATRNGVRRLYQSLNRKALRSQVRWLPRWDEITLWSASLFDKATLEDQCALLIADLAFLRKNFPRTQTDYESRLEDKGERIGRATQEVATVVPRLMEALHKVKLAREQFPNNKFARTREDIDHQLSCMLHATFLSDTPWQWLQHFPRYLQGIEHRLSKTGSTGESIQQIDALQSYWQRIEVTDEDSIETDRDALLDFRWMLEEYRVSLFAQQLGTSTKVSPQRLDKQWEKTRTT